MLQMPLTKVGPSTVASHLRHNTPPDYRHSTSKVVVTGFVGGKFDNRLLECREFLVNSQAFEDNLGRTVCCFVPIKQKADRSARLDRNHIWVIPILHCYLNFLHTVAPADGTQRDF